MGEGAPSQRYQELLESHGLLLVNGGMPTRAVNGSNSLIDHVFCRLCSGGVDNVRVNDLQGISDHSAVLVSLEFGFEPCPPPVAKRFVNLEALKYAVLESSWEEVKLSESPDCACELLISKCDNLIQGCSVPRQEVRVNRPIKEWVTPGLVKCLRKRDTLYRTWSKTGDPVDRLMYNSFRNKVRKILRKAKDSYYAGLIQEAGTDSRRIWRVIG